MSNNGNNLIEWYEKIVMKQLYPYQKQAIELISSDRPFKINTRGRKY